MDEQKERELGILRNFVAQLAFLWRIGDDLELLKAGATADALCGEFNIPVEIDEDEEPQACECDNTHETNDTVCRWCWEHGRRHWNDSDVRDA